jgi:hypothetical protein
MTTMTHPPTLSRRDCLKLAAAGTLGGSLSGWFEVLASAAAPSPQRKRSCILLWMAGGPSQMDTFDLKPGHANGGPFKEIATAVPGIKLSEHLPKLARQAKRMALVRSMSTREGDHFRGTAYLHAGYLDRAPIRYPTLGSLVAKELGSDDSALPHFVSIGPALFPTEFPFVSPGFLGPRYAPLVLGADPRGTDADYEKSLRVPDLAPSGGVTPEQSAARLGLLKQMQKEFGAHHGVPAVASRRAAYDRAMRLMQTKAARAFDLDREPAGLRDRYGCTHFGQGCLLARRLVERGVPFVEVILGTRGATWDSHADNFNQVRRLSDVLDPAWATLMEDLAARGLLDSTLIVWMGEFGRTPKINGNRGRDHFPNAWTAVLAGGGIRGGQAFGKTSKDGSSVEGRKVSAPDLLATVCLALGIDPQKQNRTEAGRPIRIVDKAAVPIQDLLA